MSRYGLRLLYSKCVLLSFPHIVCIDCRKSFDSVYLSSVVCVRENIELRSRLDQTVLEYYACCFRLNVWDILSTFDFCYYDHPYYCYCMAFLTNFPDMYCTYVIWLLSSFIIVSQTLTKKFKMVSL